LRKERDVSSVGSERLLDRQEVTGSTPVRPTQIIMELERFNSFLFYSGCNMVETNLDFPNSCKFKLYIKSTAFDSGDIKVKKDRIMSNLYPIGFNWNNYSFDWQ
jgi:hypothetical protein